MLKKVCNLICISPILHSLLFTLNSERFTNYVWLQNRQCWKLRYLINRHKKWEKFLHWQNYQLSRNTDVKSLWSRNTGGGVLTEHCWLRWHPTTAEQAAAMSSWPTSSWQNASLRHSSSSKVKESKRLTGSQNISKQRKTLQYMLINQS